jgi:hypothetical protein
VWKQVGRENLRAARCRVRRLMPPAECEARYYEQAAVA